jgi:hypothetical protein
MDGAGMPNSGKVDGKLGTAVEMGTEAGMGPAMVGAGNPEIEGNPWPEERP